MVTLLIAGTAGALNWKLLEGLGGDVPMVLVAVVVTVYVPFEGSGTKQRGVVVGFGTVQV